MTPRGLAFAALLLALGCRAPLPAENAAPTPAAFADRVWRVAESSAMSPGQLVVFLSEGTLVFASPHDKPALGRWTFENGELTMVEEGIPYRVEILSASETELRLRSHNPGEPVETRFVPATSAARP